MQAHFVTWNPNDFTMATDWNFIHEAMLLGTVVRKHYENMPIQIYYKFYHQKMKIFR